MPMPVVTAEMIAEIQVAAHATPAEATAAAMEPASTAILAMMLTTCATMDRKGPANATAVSHNATMSASPTLNKISRRAKTNPGRLHFQMSNENELAIGSSIAMLSIPNGFFQNSSLVGDLMMLVMATLALFSASSTEPSKSHSKVVVDLSPCMTSFHPNNVSSE